MRDGSPAQIDIKQFEMVTIPDAEPTENINVDKVEDVAVDKNENLIETNE